MFDAIFSFDTLWVILTILYVPACIGLIVIVLLQKGKGTGFAGAFGAGAGPGAEAVFGPKSGQTLPVRLTYFAAITFMVIAVLMSIIAGRVGKGTAPDLLEVTDGEVAISGDAFDGFGIGTGQAGSATEAPAVSVTSDAPAKSTPLSITVDASGTTTSSGVVVTPGAETQDSESSDSPE